MSVDVSSVNTVVNGYNSFTGSSAMGALGATNLALSSCATIIQTSTRTLTFISSATWSGGVIAYVGDPAPQTYMQATRIA